MLLRAGLAGLALGVGGFAAGSLILYEARGVLSAAGGVVATFAAALAAGLWAGAPGARGDTPPTWRWVGAGIGLAVAGAFGTFWAVWQLERYGGAARALALLFLVGVPVYALGFLLPALAAWAARAADEDDEGDAMARGAADVVLAALIGAAIGAAASGLLLLPALAPGLLLLPTGALLTVPLFFPRDGAAGDAVEERLVHQEETAYGMVRVTEIRYPGDQRQPEMRLYVNDEVESGELERSGAPTFGYVAAAERWLRDATPGASRYLFLGGGACTLPRRIAEDDPRAAVTVVELDPAVTRAAYRWFGLRPEHGVTAIHGDARAVAATLPAGAFDRVVVDVYGGDEQIPLHLATVEAFAVYRRLLAPGGAVLVNVIGVASGEGECRFWSTVRTAAQAFPAVRLYVHIGRDFPDRQNFLLAAAPELDFPFPGRAGMFQPWPVDEWPALPCASVLRDRAGTRDDGAPAAPPEGRGGRAVPASAD